MPTTHLIAYDIGTTGVKTCLFEVSDVIRLVSYASRSYPLYVLDNGGVEQDGDDWWNAMCESTKEIFASSDIRPEQIGGISFCSQMQALILVDRDGVPVHRPMSYMDQRAREEIKKGIAYGIQIAGANILKLIPSLILTGAVTSSVKDPVWKYKWLEAHEPENFARAYRWLDAKDYLISRCTDRFIMTPDSAFSTFLYDTRKGHEGWSKYLCNMLDIKMDLLPEIIRATDCVGGLTERAADELGLAAGTPVFGSGGDSTLIGVGAGTVREGKTHIYSGTSGWVATVTNKQMVDADAMMAAIMHAVDGRFNYFGEMETAGKCFEWAVKHLTLDELGTCADGTLITETVDAAQTNIYNYITEAIKDVPAGSNGVIFTPWLHGNRCPFEAPDAAGMFFNLHLETNKADLVHAVLEGVCYHMRWILDCQKKKLMPSDPIRFVGGSALSPVTCQMLADVLGCTIETVDSPQNVGSVGAAALAAVGLGLMPSLDCVEDFIPATATYTPNAENHAAYEKYYRTFRELYKTNSRLFKGLNG